MSDFQEFDLVKNEGFNFDLTKEDPSINKIRIDIKWDETVVKVGNDTESADLDLMALLLNNQSQLTAKQNVVFYGQKESPTKAVVLPRDTRNGGVESIYIDASKIPDDTPVIALYASVYDDPKVPYQFSFSEVTNASVTVYNDETNEAKVKYHLTKDFAGVTMLHIGDLIKSTDGGVTFAPEGNGGNMNLNQVCQFYCS